MQITINRRKRRKTMDSILVIVFLLSFFSSLAQSIQCDYEIYPETNYITNWSVQPGDTICLMAGNRSFLYFKNIIGTAENPVVIINKGGQCIIDSDLSYGLKFAESKHIALTGTGDDNYEYGIHILEVSGEGGMGLDIGGLSTDFEVDHLEIGHVKVSGILAKTDPNCIYPSDRSNFTMYNLKIHNNYIHDTGDEGMYIGSSFFLGYTPNGCDTVQFPHIIDGVEVYNNRVEYTGWDGIQVGSALYNCSIHDNFIYKDSQAEATYQMSGIMVNSGSCCDVYNNQIIDGKGTGIINQGTGGQKFYNNLIVNAGIDYFPGDQTTKQQFGIFSKYVYIHPPDSSFLFHHNTIINPKSDGIRFWNSHSENNRFINNIIINPGTYDYYENLGSVNYEAQDAYIHNYLDEADIFLTNNILERSSKGQFFVDTINYDYHLTINSPAANSGYNLRGSGITFDIENYFRPIEDYFDIGAYELQILTPINTLSKANDELVISPNPASDFLSLYFDLEKNQKLNLKIVSMEGKEFTVFSDKSFSIGKNQKSIAIDYLPSAKYVLVLYNESFRLTQKFQKI